MSLFVKKLLLASDNRWGFNQITGDWQRVINTDSNNCLAVGYDGYYTISSNGISWSEPAQVTGLEGYELKTAAYNTSGLPYAMAGNGFVSAGYTYNDMGFVTLFENINWNDITFGGNKIVAVGQSSGYLATASSNYPSGAAITWAISSSKFGSLTSPQRIVYISDLSLFVTVGNSGYVSTSTNGTTWTTPIQIASYIYWNDIIYAEGKIILLGSRLAGGSSYVSTSTNGTTWTTPVSIGNAQRSIAYANGTYITCGNSGKICISTDLNSWESSTTEIAANWRSIIANSQRFVMVGNNYVAYKEF